MYRDVLSFLPDEEVLAVYPEKAQEKGGFSLSWFMSIHADRDAFGEQSQDCHHLRLRLLRLGQGLWSKKNCFERWQWNGHRTENRHGHDFKHLHPAVTNLKHPDEHEALGSS